MRNSTERYYRPGLDAVRLIAFLMVFLNHSLPVSDSRFIKYLGPDLTALYDLTDQCWRFGLSLFFTLSAFLIFELLQRERHLTGSVGVKQFYLRRILRIWPLYYLALLLGVWWAFRFGNGVGDLPQLGWFAVFLGSWFVNTHGWIVNGAYPLWSISVEEQFYLFAPWLTKYCGRRLLFGFCALIVVIANWTLYLVAREPGTYHDTWTNSLIQFECFAAGMLLSLCLNGGIPKTHTSFRVLALVGAAVFWLVAGNIFSAFDELRTPSGSWQLMIAYGLAAVGSSLIVWAMLDFQGGRYSQWAIHLGRISYGLYVFHSFALFLFAMIPMENTGMNGLHSHVLRAALILAVRVAAPLLATYILAELSYRFFERPFLRMKQRHTVIVSQPQEIP